jgi:hypothetical protein
MESITHALEAAREDIQERKREIQWQAYRVKVNDLLPCYQRVVDRFREARIPITDTFGSTSETKRVPDYYVLAFGPDVAVEALQEVMRAIAVTGVEYLDYSYATPEMKLSRF